jgi:hypothetical protein
MVFDPSAIKQIAELVTTVGSAQNTLEALPQTMATQHSTVNKPLVVHYKDRMTLLLTRRRILFGLREWPYFLLGE